MTLDEYLATVRERAQSGFTRWWFAAGGAIHGVWKRRQWSALRMLAEDLPRKAWEEGSRDVHRLLAIIEVMKKRIVHRDGCGWGSTACEACDTLDEIDEIYRIAKGEL